MSGSPADTEIRICVWMISSEWALTRNQQGSQVNRIGKKEKGSKSLIVGAALQP